jgi:AbrB family looped-hinge helix DNA binding protein
MAIMETRTQLGKNGRIVLPARIRRALEIEPGDEIVLRVETDGSIRLIPLRQAIRLAQKSVRRYVSKDTSLVDALIDARREEANRG